MNIVISVRRASGFCFLVLLLATQFSCRPDPSREDAPLSARPGVFILAGQSNMAGRGVTSDLPSDLRNVPPRVTYILSGVEAGFGDRATFGPEVGFAHHLSGTWPGRDLILIKHAVGATSLLAWAPAWDSVQAARTRNAGAGPLYETLLSQVRTSPLPENAEFLGVLWMQGERDANYPPVADEYLQNLETLVQSFRRDLGEPEIPFFLGQINTPSSGWPAAPAVREAQAASEARIPLVVMIPTDDLTKREDEPVHYDTGGLLELGYRFSKAVAAYYSDSGRGL